MSGHSHWAGIKHKKGLEDAKRAKVFAKLARVIIVAAREKGGNMDMNPGLRLAVEKARAGNMPSDNIERAIKRGTGEGAQEALEGFLYEAFAPGGAAVLVEGITDNKNRSLNEVRKIITSQGGRMADPGSVQWMFDRKGYIDINLPAGGEGSTEDLELKLIDAGADDMRMQEGGMRIYTAPEKLSEVRKKLEEAGVVIAETGFEYVPKIPVPVPDSDKQKLESFFESLDDHDDVQDIFTNAQFTY
jgi:YebC/PmpR family DNA-binding regulatory protein